MSSEICKGGILLFQVSFIRRLAGLFKRSNYYKSAFYYRVALNLGFLGLRFLRK